MQQGESPTPATGAFVTSTSSTGRGTHRRSAVLLRQGTSRRRRTAASALHETFEAGNLHAAHGFEFVETTHPPATDAHLDIDRAVNGITMIVQRDHADLGSHVTAALVTANHDPDRFADPDRFDLHRHGGADVAFGHGIHFCLGARLAKLEAETAIGTLLSVAPISRSPSLPTRANPPDRPRRPTRCRCPPPRSPAAAYAPRRTRQQQRFFASAKFAAGWLDQHPGAFLLGVADAYDLLLPRELPASCGQVTAETGACA